MAGMESQITIDVYINQLYIYCGDNCRTDTHLLLFREKKARFIICSSVTFTCMWNNK